MDRNDWSMLWCQFPPLLLFIGKRGVPWQAFFTSKKKPSEISSSAFLLLLFEEDAEEKGKTRGECSRGPDTKSIKCPNFQETIDLSAPRYILRECVCVCVGFALFSSLHIYLSLHMASLDKFENKTEKLFTLDDVYCTVLRLPLIYATRPFVFYSYSPHARLVVVIGFHSVSCWTWIFVQTS